MSHSRSSISKNIYFVESELSYAHDQWWYINKPEPSLNSMQKFITRKKKSTISWPKNYSNNSERIWLSGPWTLFQQRKHPLATGQRPPWDMNLICWRSTWNCLECNEFHQTSRYYLSRNGGAPVQFLNQAERQFCNSQVTMKEKESPGCCRNTLTFWVLITKNQQVL